MQCIDLSKLLGYFNKLEKIIYKIYPVDIPLSEQVLCQELSAYKHPDWVQAHFPLILIIYRPKAGKLRNSKKESIVYQNHNNVITQVVWRADDFGIYKRKNEHKGFKDIVAALVATIEDLKPPYWIDKQKPEKFKNFQELARVKDPANIYLRALCDILQKHYPCDSTGQIRLL